jgi:DNA-binding response OmpR family regulator
MDMALKKILIIEDDKSIARALELKLTREGFEVSILPNGENVLPTLQKTSFSLIVCDLIMPKVDGFEVLKVLQDNKVKIPVIVLTNLNQTEDEKRVKELGVTDFIVKSDTLISEVVEKIKEKIF